MKGNRSIDILKSILNKLWYDWLGKCSKYFHLHFLIGYNQFTISADDFTILQLVTFFF